MQEHIMILGLMRVITIALGYEYGAPNGIAIRAELAYINLMMYQLTTELHQFNVSKKRDFITEMEGATGRISLVKSF
jgi:hypothetical protein